MSDPTPSEVVDMFGIEEPHRRLVKNHRGDWIEDLTGDDPDMWDHLVDQGFNDGREACCVACGAVLFVYCADGDVHCNRCLRAWGED